MQLDLTGDKTSAFGARIACLLHKQMGFLSDINDGH